MPKSSKRLERINAGPYTADRPPTEKEGASKLYSSFLPVPLVLPAPIPIQSSSSKTTLDHVTHHLYIRAHRPHRIKEAAVSNAVDGKAEGRTIFAVNLPVDMTERDLRVLFGKWGVVETADINRGRDGGSLLEDAVSGLPAESDDEEEEEEERDEAEEKDETVPPGVEPRFIGTGGPSVPRSKRRRRKPQLSPSVPETMALPPLDPRQTPYEPSGARSAHITFLDPVSVTRAMSYSGSGITILKYGEDPANPTGLEYYTRLHDSLRPSLASVKQHADSAMARHDHLHSLLLSSRAKKQGAGALVDEDGFTVVVRGGKYGRTSGSGVLGVGVATKKDEAGGKKKKGIGGGELADFYRFQKVDRKRQELAGLRKRFEDDKERVEEMKMAKRFKHY